ncbi:aromatic ring-hydroxylating dioxygenase subunit alpha [SAR202 cluster bacterium AD-802-E10_MRT_200m]|nr:aromatic ring-hydroxylating dioxygenase subunit alpha [SAR202 cluster bacterium AD-802-E10_MRT_200m]MQF82776.1 aromatic ring-hydroxylating dioxygenase subunit alpha [SAR202 cluster bacterium AD-802-E10_MRT_200m]
MPQKFSQTDRTIRSDFKQSFKTISEASHAPGIIYSDPEVFKMEKDRLFLNDWLLVGRLEELSNPGDYMTWTIAGEPIIITKTENHELKAFYNMCAHRGVQVADGQGNTKTFKCPYHGWVYDLSGKLLGAAYMERVEGFDPNSCSLAALPIDTWAGNIFISFNRNADPLEEFLGEFTKEFQSLRPEACRLANKIELELDCNWKFVTENLMDMYHVGVLHAGSFGARFSWKEEDVHLKARGEFYMQYSAGPPTPNAEPLLGKMPWLEDQPESYASTGFLAPNLTIFGRIDCVRIFTIWPQSAKLSKVVIYHLFPEEFFSFPEFTETLKVYRDYQIKVIEEDRTMIESLQRGVESRGFVPGRMSTLETPIHNYLQGYLNRMFPS